MNTFRFINIRKTGVLFIPLFFFSVVLFTACDNDEKQGDAYFEIEEAPTGFTVGANGGESPKYVVRSNRPWQVLAQEENDWVRAFPNEGDDDGIFRFIVQENRTINKRIANFSFIVGGAEQPMLFRIEQQENIPFIKIDKGDEGVNIPAAGGQAVINIDANVDWEYSIVGDNWLESHKREGEKIIIVASQNIDAERELTLRLTSPSESDLAAEIVITQSSVSVILEEDFNWLAYGNAIPYETSGEKVYGGWTEAEKARGWSSTPVETAADKFEQLCYARQGFVKLGKTNWGGDLISPKLEKIEGTANVKVTFKAAGYISAGGAVDDTILKIEILGAGSSVTTEIDVKDNIPNNRAQDAEGRVNDIWDPARAYSFVITGATSETQIKFLGRDYDLNGVGQGKNRIFLDDIKVELIFD